MSKAKDFRDMSIEELEAFTEILAKNCFNLVNELKTS